MLKILFILGRPGCGKSTTASLIRMMARDQRWLFHSLNDYVLLQDMCLHEEAENIPLNERDFIQRELDGCIGFDVKNFGVLRTVLRKLKEEVEVIRVTSPQDRTTLCTIEFARALYQDALDIFGNELLAEAHLLYINVDVDTCIQRNHNRTDHFISDEIMRTYYHYDDWAREVYNLDHGRDKFAIKNMETFEDLRQEVESWFASHLLSEALFPKVPDNMM